MAHNTLSRRALASKTNVVGKYINDFESCGYATYFYLGTPEGPINYGSKAIEEHVTLPVYWREDLIWEATYLIIPGFND